MSVIDKGADRYSRYQRAHAQRFGTNFKGRLLDFGCGAGGFLLAALRNGIDVHGVEVDGSRHEQFKRYVCEAEPKAAERFTLYDGRLAPFPSNHFDGCHSFFVFEHVTDPQISLREIARVLKPGGTAILYADDVRNAWDGHICAPWPPYMPREFAAGYLEGLELSRHADFITKYVVYISAPVIVDILTTLGMEIVYSNAPADRDPLLEGLYVTNEKEARELGTKVRERGGYQSPAENLTIFARKR